MHHIMHTHNLSFASNFTLVHLRKRNILHTITLISEAVRLSEMLIPTFQTTWCHNQDILSLSLQCYVNLSEETAELQEVQLPLPQRLVFLIKYQKNTFF